MAQTNTLPLSIKLLRFIYSRIGPLAPHFFGRRAYHTWFSTTRFKTPQREQPALASARKGSVRVDGIEVATYRWGDSTRPTVLFIPGWSGRGSQACAFIDPLIDAGYNLLSFDAPAHGKTPGKQTSVLQFADALLVLQEKLGPFHGCISHSVGGMALALAAQHGFHAKRAVLICPPNDFTTILRNFSRILALPLVVQQAMLQHLYATHGSLIKRIVVIDLNAANIAFPALLIHNRHDPEIPWQDSQKIHRAWRKSDLMLTDGLKHYRIVRDEQVVNAAVKFLSAT